MAPRHMPPGFMLYHDHVMSAARLTDAEFGRLIRALAVYSETEIVPELQEPEIYLFDLFRAVVDTNKAKYLDRCETNSKNSRSGLKGSKTEKEAELQASPGTEDPIDPSTADNDRQRSSANGSQSPLNKNINKNKNKKQTIKQCPPYSPPGGTPPGDTDGFETFFDAYPLHVSKQDALKAWNQLNPDSALRHVILSAIEKQKQCDQWNREGGRFIPNPANWLRGHRWEDEPQQTQSRASPHRNPQGDFSQRDYHDSQEESLTDTLNRQEQARAKKSSEPIIPAAEAPKAGI